MAAILDAENINTFYGRSHILFDVSLSVQEGETVCLMGRNGAGKTTTFRTRPAIPMQNRLSDFQGEKLHALPILPNGALGAWLCARRPENPGAVDRA